MQLHVLNVHLLDFEVTVRVDLERRRPGGEYDFLFRQAGKRHLPAANVKTADLLDAEMASGLPSRTALLLVHAGTEQKGHPGRRNRLEFRVQTHVRLR